MMTAHTSNYFRRSTYRGRLGLLGRTYLVPSEALATSIDEGAEFLLLGLRVRVLAATVTH